MQRMEEGTSREYARELADLIEQSGADRTDKAVQDAIRASEFFPTIAKIRALVPKRQDDLVHYNPDCLNCIEGWVTIKPDEFGNKHVKRCACWRSGIYQTARRSYEHGFGTPEIKALMKLVFDRAAKFRKDNYQRLTDQEISELCKVVSR